MQLSKIGLLIGGILLLSSCGSLGTDEFASDIGGFEPQSIGVSDTPVRIGAPYKVGNTTYTPEDVAAYDEIGYASWYGSNFNGRQTANGERFSATSFSGAHKTLPLPTYVEVTNLETGRTILVRINDRGPFADDRLIDLSEAAARQLGIIEQGVAGVRVRKVNPPEQERAILRNGSEASLRTDTPDSLTRILRDRLAKLPKPKAPVRVATPSPRPTVSGNSQTNINSGNGFVTDGGRRSDLANRQSNNGRFIVEGPGAVAQNNRVSAPSGFVVQLSSFSSRDRAFSLARKVGGNVAQSSDGRLFRVRFGPYATEAEAQQGLAKAQQQGYPQARIFRE